MNFREAMKKAKEDFNRLLEQPLCLDGHNCPRGQEKFPSPPVGLPSDIGTANVEGTSRKLARLDHVHNHPAGLGVDLHHPQLHAPDHLVGAGDPLAVGVPVAIGVANAEGAATNLARRDHVHNHPAGLGATLHHDPVHKCIIGGSTMWNSLDNAATEFLCPVGSDADPGNNEGVQCIVMPCAGTLRNFYVITGGAPGAGKSWTFTIRVGPDGALGDTAIVVTISDAANAGHDTVNTAAVTAGQCLSIKIVPAGTPADEACKWGIEFDPAP